jgi:uncharacterized membrane protein YhaH (DUF805 family)
MFAAVGSVYANMFDFRGRARRAEYWWFVLFVFVLNIAFSAGLALWMFGQADVMAALAADGDVETLLAQIQGQFLRVGAVAAVVMLFAIFIPQLAVTVRRLHDTGRSGWWMFKPFLISMGVALGVGFLAISPDGTASPALLIVTYLTPLACQIWYFVVMCLPGERGDNRFGPDPIEDRMQSEAGHPALVKEMDEELSRQVAEQRREEFKDYYRARVLPAIERNKTRRA